MKAPPISCRVNPPITTWSGPASASRRAARFGVSPAIAPTCRRPGALDVADDDGAGSDPDMHLERQFLCRGDRREPGADRLRRLVLVGARPAEIGEDAVAEIIGDIAAIALDDGGHRIVIAAQQLAQILRIVPARQLGRADQIAEQHRELAPLGRADRVAARAQRRQRGTLSVGRLRSLARPLGDRAQQPAAMAERQPQLLQILVAELGQQVEIDVVGGKDLGVLLQSDLPRAKGADPRTNLYPQRGPASPRTPSADLPTTSCTVIAFAG